MSYEELSPEQKVCVDRVRQVLDDFGGALAGAAEVGVQPIDALRCAGVEIPGWAAPMVGKLQLKLLPG